MNWYDFTQNNSGGGFVVNETLCHRIFIEAENSESATAKAVELGVYFNGCDDGTDCPCCGDRWNTPWEDLTFPMQYGGERIKTVEDYAQMLADRYSWTTPDIRLFYIDGRVLEISSKGRNWGA